MKDTCKSCRTQGNLFIENVVTAKLASIAYSSAGNTQKRTVVHSIAEVQRPSLDIGAKETGNVIEQLSAPKYWNHRPRLKGFRGRQVYGVERGTPWRGSGLGCTNKSDKLQDEDHGHPQRRLDTE